MRRAYQLSPRTARFTGSVRKADLRTLYADTDPAQTAHVLAQLGPLQEVYARFISSEQTLRPYKHDELIRLFDACGDLRSDAEQLGPLLRQLAPGNGHIGAQQVTILVDHLRSKVGAFLQSHHTQLSLPLHDHAFGSGGDFWKTGHATTNAAIVVAPLLPICKTGTTQVTAEHGSYQAIQELGYIASRLEPQRVTQQLTEYGFAFIPLAALGFPYSDALRLARKRLWNEARALIETVFSSGTCSWQEAVRTTQIPLDIFKVVSPNAQVLNPANHSTGVYHLSMLPYVLAIYFHLGTTGMIVHCYDGIDELSNATSDRTEYRPNNLVIRVETDQVTIAEVSPEDLGFVRAELRDIEEDKLLSHDAATFWQILSGVKQGPKRDFVAANAAVLLVAGHRVVGPTDDIVAQIRVGTAMAQQLIDSGSAYTNFVQLLAS